MRLVDFFKWLSKSVGKTDQSTAPKDFKTQLDLLEKEVFAKLKPLGFRKKGRTFNRRLDDGIIQVINFQSGQYPVGQHYEIPGLRESSYGKFVVNLGVCIEKLYNLSFPNNSKTFYQEHDCQIRIRLGALLTGEDYWWPISINTSKILSDVITGIETKAFDWFSGIDTKEKVIANNGHLLYNTSPRAKLDTALIVYFDDKARGAELFKAYYHGIQPASSPHKAYVRELANQLKIDL